MSQLNAHELWSHVMLHLYLTTEAEKCHENIHTVNSALLHNNLRPEDCLSAVLEIISFPMAHLKTPIT